MDRPFCEYYIANQCEVVGTNYSPSPETCKACSLAPQPCTLNELTTLIQLRRLRPNDPPGDQLLAAVPWLTVSSGCGSCDNRVEVINTEKQPFSEILNLLRESAMDTGRRVADRYLAEIARQL